MDRAEIDENGKGLLFYGKSLVKQCVQVEGQNDVFLLKTNIILERKTQLTPKPGQFYLIRSHRSKVEFDRPISVYKATESTDSETGLKIILLEFLILKKGTGTQELCSLLPGDEIDAIGPLGNTFELPKNLDLTANQKPQVCIVGGGIGVAPVANFASSLQAKTYDFFASFKSGSYGLENVCASTLTITTDDGSVGIHGMLPEALTADKIKQAGYKVIYACGPNPMLCYVQKIAQEANVPCFVSMENKMLCGVGACLGCTISTKKGKLRVCKDGPVFDASIVQFEQPQQRRKSLLTCQQPDLSVNIAGVRFLNPVIAASGTFGFGQNYRGLFDVSKIGGISSKGVTLEPRQGNDGVRIVEVPRGNINSIGLQNPGVQHAIENEFPEMIKLHPVVSIANLAGGTIESYVKGAELIDKTEVQMIELNISCPNVSAGGMAWGTKPELSYQVVSAVRKATKKPLIVKLSPNAPDIVAVALECIKAGADAISLINTIQAVSIDIYKAKPAFDRIRAGLCGPAIKPIALRMVYDVVEAINKLPEDKRVPVIGMGGISTWEDAVEFIMAGASAIQIGSAKFSNPNVMIEVIEGLKDFMIKNGYATISEMCGIAQLNK